MYQAYRPQQLQTPLSTIPGLYAEFKPARSLRQHIVCYWIAPLRSEAPTLGRSLVEPLIPDGCIDLVALKERSTGEIDTLLVGTLEAPARVSMELDRLQTFGVRFHPGGLQPFLREPAHLFTGRINSLPDVCPTLWRDLAAIHEQSGTLEGLLTAADRLFATRLQDAAPVPWQATLLSAVTLLTTVHSGLSIRGLAERLAVSERQLLRVFLERTGLSPKQFARTIRFQRALSLLHGQEGAALSEIALSCGYYDQAHFTREFVSLTGITPGRYARSGGIIQDLG